MRAVIEKVGLHKLKMAPTVFLKVFSMSLLSWVGILLATALTACFQERTPATPTRTSDFVSATEPSVLIQNLAAAYSGLNADNVIRCFNEDRFRFIPEPTVTGAVNLFATWTLRKEERDVLINLKNRTTSTTNNRLSFEGVQQNFITPDSLEYLARYNLKVFQSDTSFNGTDLAGKVRFVMVRNPSTNEWRINLWQDNALSTGQLCWTDLKARFIVP